MHSSSGYKPNTECNNLVFVSKANITHTENGRIISYYLFVPITIDFKRLMEVLIEAKRSGFSWIIFTCMIKSLKNRPISFRFSQLIPHFRYKYNCKN